MSWRSPRMSTSPPPPASPAGASSTAIATSPPPETPESVRDLGPSVCFDVGLFRELMKQYRNLDDGVTTRLNRTLAQSRSSGQSHPPSLLESSPSSESSRSSKYYSDLGTSTYSTLNQSSCESFFKELVANWSGRESVLRYCLAVIDAQAADKTPSPVPVGKDDDAGLLDADKRTLVQQGQNATSGGGHRPIFTDWDSRGSRAEKSDEALRRQIHNEASVDQIVRTRSLQAFKSRCSLFRLPPNATEQEKRFWEGN
ncbi:unnamed protein product [Sympodiomycopsis kandeliae]